MTNKIKTTGKTFEGIVVSDKMSNTIVVQMEYAHQHPMYAKIVRKNKKIYAENNLSAKLGDFIKVMEVKPLSKLKRFTTLEILKKAN
jgi:small subunit ribosomal protein S17